MREHEASLRMRFFGHPRFEFADGEILVLTSKKAVALLALLATADHGTRSRVWLQQKLWGSRDTRQAQSSLRREIAYLRKALDTRAEAILETTQRAICLRPEACWSDVANLDAVSGASETFLEGLDIAGEEDFEDWLREMRGFFAERISHRPQTGPLAIDVGSEEAEETGLRSVVAVRPVVGAHLGPDDRYILQGLTRTITDRLSCLRWLPVIAPESSFSSELTDASDLEMASFLKARYLLHTELLVADGRSAINFTLMEMPARVVRWRETRPLDDHRDLQEAEREIDRAVNCLASVFELNEQRRSMESSAPSGDTLRDLWRVRFHIAQFTEEDLDEAERLLEIARPNMAEHSEFLLLQIDLLTKRHWIRRAAIHESAKLLPLARAAMRADPSDARGPLYAGILETWHRRTRLAIEHLENSRQLNPSFALAYAYLGSAYYLNGEPEKAIAPLEHALYLSPLDPHRFWMLGELAVSLFMLERFDLALRTVTEIQLTHPGYILSHVVEIGAHMALGEREEAGATYTKLLGDKPHLLDSMLAWMPFRDAYWLDRLRDGVERVEASEARVAIR